MKIVVIKDATHIHFELTPEDNVDKGDVDIIGTVTTAEVKRNGALRFSVTLQRVPIGKYVVNSEQNQEKH